MSPNTTTRTSTYTVVDVRKTFENFAADLGMIAGKTRKWDTAKVAEMVHDIMLFAENYYLDRVDILLLDSSGKPIQVASYTANENGSALTGERAGGNDWPCLENTRLSLLIGFSQSWKNLDAVQQQEFRAKLNNPWGGTRMDATYSHLQSQSAQKYASNGFELNKQNFK